MDTNATTTELTDDVTGFHCGGHYAPYYGGFGGYVVQPGDSLFAIAQRMYGDGRLWPVLFAANADVIRNPNLIFAGQRLRMPA
jgi:hypothetical protein